MESQHIVRTKSILKKLTPENFHLIKNDLLIHSGITTADIFKEVVSLIHERALLKPAYCPMYAQLCSDLNMRLPAFTSEEPWAWGINEIAFDRVLLNKCKETFGDADRMRAEIRQMSSTKHESECRDKENLLRLRTLGNIRFIGELFKQNMVPETFFLRIAEELNMMKCPEDLNVEALCLLFRTIGKQLDESFERHCSFMYLLWLSMLPLSPKLAPHIRSMVRDVLDLRANNWVPRREERKKLRENVLRCYCGMVAQLTTSEIPQNHGRRFLTCPEQIQCGFFIWEDMYLWIIEDSKATRLATKAKKFFIYFIGIAMAVIWFLFSKNNAVDGGCKCGNK